MNVLRLIVYLIRRMLWLALTIIGSRLVLVLLGFIVFIMLSLGAYTDLLMFTLIAATVINLVSRSVALWIAPRDGVGWVRRTRRQKAKQVPPSIVTSVARAGDAPDERLFTGRLPVALRQLLDPPGSELRESIAAAPVRARPLQRPASPATDADG